MKIYKMTLNKTLFVNTFKFIKSFCVHEFLMSRRTRSQPSMNSNSEKEYTSRLEKELRRKEEENKRLRTDNIQQSTTILRIRGIESGNYVKDKSSMLCSFLFLELLCF